MTHGLHDSEQAPPRPGVPSTESAFDRQQLPPDRSIGRAVLGQTVVVAIALVLLVWFWPQTARAAGPGSAPGEQLYTQHCASCHQAAGQGVEGTFPPLVGNPAAADAAYVESVVRDGLSGPIDVLGVAYDAVMPPVSGLTDAGEIQQVVQYVTELAAPSGDGQDAQPAEGEVQDEGEIQAEGEIAGPVVGDVDRGHELFIGSARLDNGGPACAACHTAGSVGNLGGSSLGPDLTATFATLGGEAGLTGWLANPPSPTMLPLFENRPLTEPEVADVIAFLADAPTQDRPPSNYDRLTVAGLGGLIALIAGMTLAWRGMRQTYVERLRSRPGAGQRAGRTTRTRVGTGVGARRGPTPVPQPGRPEQTAQAGRRSR